jgi:hypothetical protein
MSLYEASVPQLKKMLENLERWLDQGVEHARKNSIEPSTLLGARLAPDQYPLYRQIQSACDAAKFAVARLTDKRAPVHPDTEQPLETLRERLREVVSYLGSFRPEDFEGADSRRLSLPFLEGRQVMAGDYFNEMALPNFYFHVVTAYAILRHNGVELGKRDFIGGMKLVES